MPSGSDLEVALHLRRVDLRPGTLQLGRALDPLEVAAALDPEAQRGGLAQRDAWRGRGRPRRRTSPTAPRRPGSVGQRDRPSSVSGCVERSTLPGPASKNETRPRHEPERRRRDGEAAGPGGEEQLAQDREAHVALAFERDALALRVGVRAARRSSAQKPGYCGGSAELHVGDGGLRVDVVGDEHRLADVQPACGWPWPRPSAWAPARGAGRARNRVERIVAAERDLRRAPRRLRAAGWTLPATTSRAIGAVVFSPLVSFTASAPISAGPGPSGCSTYVNARDCDIGAVDERDLLGDWKGPPAQAQVLERGQRHLLGQLGGAALDRDRELRPGPPRRSAWRPPPRARTRPRRRARAGRRPAAPPPARPPSRPRGRYQSFPPLAGFWPARPAACFCSSFSFCCSASRSCIARSLGMPGLLLEALLLLLLLGLRPFGPPVVRLLLVLLLSAGPAAVFWSCFCSLSLSFWSCCCFCFCCCCCCSARSASSRLLARVRVAGRHAQRVAVGADRARVVLLLEQRVAEVVARRGRQRRRGHRRPAARRAALASSNLPFL